MDKMVVANIAERFNISLKEAEQILNNQTVADAQAKAEARA